MNKHELIKGESRTQVHLSSSYMGNDIVIRIYNENAHIGAIALGEYDNEHKRVSVSVITRLGHKEDTAAQRAAYSISKYTKRPVCVIAGIHVDNVTRGEIDQILENVNSLIDEFIFQIGK
jgi:gallate decarboxylase subunit D